MSNNKNSKVGYKNPPKHSQFKKGKSGNPKGRKKKELTLNISDLDEVFTEVLQEKVPVKIEGKRKIISKTHIVVTQVVNAAMQGNMQAIKFVIERICSLPSQYKDPQARFYRHTEADDEMIETFLEHAQTFEEEEHLRIDELVKKRMEELTSKNSDQTKSVGSTNENGNHPENEESSEALRAQ